MILLGVILALFFAWAVIAVMTLWAIVGIVLLALRVLLSTWVAFLRWGSRRPRRRVVVLDR